MSPVNEKAQVVKTNVLLFERIVYFLLEILLK